MSFSNYVIKRKCAGEVVWTNKELAKMRVAEVSKKRFKYLLIGVFSYHPTLPDTLLGEFHLKVIVGGFPNNQITQQPNNTTTATATQTPHTATGQGVISLVDRFREATRFATPLYLNGRISAFAEGKLKIYPDHSLSYPLLS